MKTYRYYRLKNAMLFACNLVPFMAILSTVYSTSHLNRDPDTLLSTIQTGPTSTVAIWMIAFAWLPCLRPR